MSLTIDQELQSGIAAHNKGKLQEAERIYRFILQSQPKNPDANHNLGVLIVSLNNSESALPLFKAALDSNPKIEKFWVSYINALINENQLQGAKLAINKAKKAGFKGEKFDVLRAQLTRSPKEKLTPLQAPPQAEIDSMIANYQSGQFEVAGDMALSLTEKFPDHSLSWKVLAAVCKQVGEVDGALAANKNSVRLDPNDAEAQANLGAILIDLEQFEEAEESLRQAIKISPDFAGAHCNLGAAMKELGRLEEAEESLRQAIKISPDFAEAHCNLGNTLTALKQFDSAVVSYNNAISINKDFQQAIGDLGIVLMKKGEHNKGLNSLRRAWGAISFDTKKGFSLK